MSANVYICQKCNQPHHPPSEICSCGCCRELAQATGSETLWTGIATCRTCKRELNRATHVPESEKTRISVSATLMCLCEERSHNTGSDYNLNFDLKWIPESLNTKGEP